MFRNVCTEDWEWLRTRCSEYDEAPGPAARRAIVAEAGKARPEMLPMLEAMIAGMQAGGDSEILSWLEAENPAEEKPTFANGELISERYSVMRYLGRGGMGEVYEVADEAMPVRGSIALKTIRRGMARNREATAQFEREIRNSLTVAHPNVCRIYDAGRNRAKDFSVLYLTMEYLPGLTLAKWLKDRDVKTRPLSETLALPLIRQITAGLAAIHATNVVHRDFKPANVILVRNGGDGFRAVITDFGLSRAMEENTQGGSKDADAPASPNTRTGFGLGTLAWMAPEQFSGETPPTSMADVYALGLIMHEMLTGQRHEPGGSLAILGKARASRRLRRVVARCLEREPAARFADAGQVAQALERAEPSLPQTGSSWVRRPLLTGALTTVVLAAVAFFLVRDTRPLRPPTEQALLQEAENRIFIDSFYDAATLLGREIRLAPHDPFAHAMLAYAYENLDLSGKANAEIVKAVAGNDLRRASWDEYLFIEGVHLTMAHDYSGAAEQFQRYLKNGKTAEKPDRAVMLGRALELAGSMAEAERVYASAGARPAALFSLAILDSKRMRIDAARREFEAARRGFQQAGQIAALDLVQLELGVALNSWGRLEDARAALESCIRQAEGSSDDYGGLRCKQALSMVAMAQDRTEEGLAATQRSLEEILRDTNRLGFQLLMGRSHVALGQINVRQGETDKADFHFGEAMTLARNEESLRLEAQVDYESADAHNRSGRSDEAEQEARRALAFYDEDHSEKDVAWCVIVLGRALRNLGRFEEALSLLQDRAALMPELASRDKAVLQHTIASVYAVEENAPAAEREYEKLLAAGLSDDPAPYLLSIATVQAQMGDLAKARDTLKSLDERKSLPGVFAISLRREKAEIELYAGSPRGAEQVVARTADGYSRTLRGLARIRIGRVTEGIDLCREALDTDLSSPVDSNARLCLLEGFGRAKNLAEASGIYDSIGTGWKPQVESRWKADALMLVLELANASLRRAAEQHLQDLRSLWGDAAFERYLARKDVETEMAATGLTAAKVQSTSAKPRFM